ncbi:Crp/Fnr family transcriptional regulator [Halomicronema sp. CCY15110]|uniref:Crp/Fnr family transcriptional regulator n=1 Tax=Halomicronema sp. CCY15110 TaxID=2767773 RepID=UPI00194F7529|nr:Crp/Fnr family transcriptional regulator [Halomicronema sp. CCY15110]
MANRTPSSTASSPLQLLIQENFLFKDLDEGSLKLYLKGDALIQEKLYASRPIYTAFKPNSSLSDLYAIVGGGPVVTRSTPLDRVISLTYPGSCFGMRNLPLAYGEACRAFPSLVEAYKTTDVIKIPLRVVEALYKENEVFRSRYELLFELREKFQYHLLNCSTYPPQAVAALLRALVYQERSLTNQPQAEGTFVFDLPTDLIACASQLNHRTVEQVLKGMIKAGLLKSGQASDTSDDIVKVVDPEGLKEVYGATRSKVAWWPLR